MIPSYVTCHCYFIIILAADQDSWPANEGPRGQQQYRLNKVNVLRFQDYTGLVAWWRVIYGVAESNTYM